MSRSFPLTDPQHAMLADSISRPGRGLWNVQLTFTLRGALDVERLKAAWQTVVDRHPVLRTRVLFAREAPPRQVVEDRVELRFEEADLSAWPDDRLEAEVARLRQAAVTRDLDFSVAPVMRLILVRARPERWFCIWIGHHAFVDGRSMYNLASEVHAAYHGGELPAAPPFTEYVAWEERQLPEGAASFWKELLGGVTHATSLGWSDDAQDPGDLGSLALRLGRGETEALYDFCKRHGVTMNALLQSAWALLLSRYSGEDDVVFGSTRACRRSALDGREGMDEMIGQLVHAVPVRVRDASSPTVLEVVREVQRQGLAVRPFEHSSPLAIHKAAELPVGSRLFETVVTFERASIPAALASRGGSWADWEVLDRGRNGYAVTLFGYEEPELLLRLEWHGAWLADAVAARVLPNLRRLLLAMVAAPDQPCQRLDGLDPAERERLLVEWNRTEVAYPRGETLHGLVEAQVERTPDRAAVRFEGQTLSYRELDRRANGVAGALRERGVGPGALVGVFLERSPELVVSLLGVLKAGAAWLPLEPEQPADRIRFMLEDAGVAALITSEALAEKLPPAAHRLLVGPAQPAPAAAAPGGGASDADPAYVIYTSGSTGKPKGAINRHRGVVNRLRWMQDTYGLGAEDRVLQKTPFGFDVSVWELFWPLMSGAELVLARPGGHRDTPYLAELVARAGITVMHFVPSLLAEFLREPGASACRCLRLAVCSGEALPVDVQDRFHALFEARLDNLYGPTEAAIDVTFWPCRREPGQSTVPIGRPVANTRIYLCDRHDRPVPIGMVGELVIGGVQVASGYLHRDELTRARFGPDPFSPEPEARLYRTGDLARYREDGVLEFLGRRDEQVKVRGLRIELEEIEAALRGHESIREAEVVVDRREGEAGRLVAFVVFGQADVPTTSDLRRFLRRWLPDPMIPSQVRELRALPRLASGKLDREALRRRLRESVEATPTPRREPCTKVERTVAAVWKSVLKVDVSAQDNFFELGGDSLRAVEAVLAIEEELGHRTDPRLMFFQSLEQIAAGLEAAWTSGH